jgi:L-ornithine N5-monooxygenase
MAPFLDDEYVAVSGLPDLSYVDRNSKQDLTPSSTGSTKFDDIPGDEDFDLICVGFGPASLAIAVALHDATYHGRKDFSSSYSPKVCFLEKQCSFRWHAGMLLPGSKMQISFIKDLATLRDPTSKFTFLNYLKCKNRLIQFTNLGTFLPTRMEFEDYLRWCADHFSEDVEYGQEVTRVKPVSSHLEKSKISLFEVEAYDHMTGKNVSRRARHVVIAVGGRPNIPAPFPRLHSGVIHSSSYCNSISRLLTSKQAPYSIAVVGSGQSAAEIFNDLQTRYPNSRSALIIKDSALRPSDDSPFVNEIFDPERVDEFYKRPYMQRTETIESNRSTNYGVVRLELIEEIYNDLYQQRVREPDERAWHHRVLASRKVADVRDSHNGRLRLTLQKVHALDTEKPEFLEVDAVVVATGYTRDVHKDFLKDLAGLNPNEGGEWQVGRNYKVDLDKDLVDEDAGIWLQGSNESSHGISDTLLSILATRSGEIVESIFGSRLKDS